MITPISNNMNSNTLSAIERPRVPRRMNSSDSVSFSGKFSPSKAVSGVKGFFQKIFNKVRNGANNLIHSKPVQTVKNGAVKGFKKTVDVIKAVPKAIGGFFKKIANKFSKKA